MHMVLNTGVPLSIFDSSTACLTIEPFLRSGKKKRLLNLGKRDKLHARMFKNNTQNKMAADE